MLLHLRDMKAYASQVEVLVLGVFDGNEEHLLLA